MNRNLMLVAGFLLLSACAAADGKFFAEISEAEPWIPQQTMIAVFRDGMETLIVESQLSAQSGKRFVWIVPLPTEPTDIRKGNPGQILSVRSCLGPEIHDSTSAALLVAVLLFFSMLLTYRIRTHKGTTLLELLILFSITVILWAIAVPNFLGDQATPQLPEIASRRDIGNYNVSILRPKRIDEMDNWFKQEGLAPLSKESYRSLDQYISEGWVFAVSQVRRDIEGDLTPHPLQFTFPANAPVFPVRLTADPNHITSIAAVVIADEPYELEGFKVIYRDRFKQTTDPYQGFSPDDPQRLPVLSSVEYMRRIGDQQIVELAGKESWITHLHSELDSKRMAADLYPQAIQSAKPQLLHLYSFTDATDKSLALGMAILLIGLPIAAGMAKRRIHFLMAVLCIFASSAVIGYVRYSLYPKTEVVHRMVMRHGMSIARSRLQGAKSQMSSQDANETETAARRAMEFAHLTEGEGPNTYRIEREGEDIVIAATDRIGWPYRINLTTLAKDSSTTESLSRQ